MDIVTEWQRLTKYYSERNDEELLELAADFEGLTEVAQGVLRDELKRRALPPPEKISAQLSSKRREKSKGASPGKASDLFGDSNLNPILPQEEEETEESSVSDYTWKVVLCECNEREDAADLMTALEGAGIESWFDESGPSLPLRPYGPRVLVAADDIEAAQQVMQRPISQDIRDQTRTPIPDFETPNCTKCGALDPLLESVDPANSWFCENCGARWSEPVRGAPEEIEGMTQPKGRFRS